MRLRASPADMPNAAGNLRSFSSNRGISTHKQNLMLKARIPNDGIPRAFLPSAQGANIVRLISNLLHQCVSSPNNFHNKIHILVANGLSNLPRDVVVPRLRQNRIQGLQERFYVRLSSQSVQLIDVDPGADSHTIEACQGQCAVSQLTRA